MYINNLQRKNVENVHIYFWLPKTGNMSIEYLSDNLFTSRDAARIAKSVNTTEQNLRRWANRGLSGESMLRNEGSGRKPFKFDSANLYACLFS
jgi:hypothetical protein